MDLDYLERQVSKLSLQRDVIVGLAEYCVLNSTKNEDQIANIIHKNFPTHYSEKMLAILDLVSEIFLKSCLGENSDNRFLKVLGAKAKVYIEEIARRVKEMKPEHTFIVPKILEKWFMPDQELFGKSFCEKLKKAAEPLYIAATKYEEQKKNNLFENYSKTFLMEYQEVKSFEPTSRIYDDYVQFDKISVEIGQINTEMKKLGLEKMTPEIVARASELRKKLERFTQRLQDIICQYHVDFKILREACKQEFERLPAEAKQILEKSS